MKSLHEQHGPNAIGVLQGAMKAGMPTLTDLGYEVEDCGNHYILKKDGKSLEVGLYAAKSVFKALKTFAV